MIFPAKKFVLSTIIRIFATREPAKPLNDAQMCGSFLFLWVYGNKDSVYKNILLSIPKEQHLFKQGVTFGKVMMLYRFDKKLRLLLFNEIEKIEVAVRCAIVNFGTEMTGSPFWMTDANNFSNPSKFNRSMRLIEDELNHTKEDFINHFKETYTNQYPPSWMLTEIPTSRIRR